MGQSRSGMVDIVRDFLGVHELLSSMIRSYADRSLEFDEVERIVGDDSSSILFRLKEACHAIFRLTASEAKPEVGAGALLDLALGSLFHEAMSLRENLYQLESYGARLKDLRDRAEVETNQLFQEFEKIQAASARRLDEAVAEVDVMLDQARRQFFLLLAEYKHDGLLTRCLWEYADQVSSTFGESVPALLSELYGDPVEGLVCAADSYLDSAYYDEALSVLHEAGRDGASDEAIDGRIHYANGMRHFMLREYPESIASLADWWGGGRLNEKDNRILLALEAVRYVESVLDDLATHRLDASRVRGLLAELKSASVG